MSRKLDLQTARSRAARLSAGPSIDSVEQVNRRLHAADGALTKAYDLPNKKRYVTERNQIVGGIFLHQLRSAKHVTCSNRFAGKLALACSLVAHGHGPRGMPQFPTTHLFHW